MISVADLGELRDATVAIAQGFDPSMLAGYEAERAVEHAAAIKNAVAYIEARAAARVAETEQWKRSGASSPEDWFSTKTGTTKAAAKDRLAAGGRLGDQDLVRDAAASGDLSVEQAAAISDAAAADPTAQERLVDVAGRRSLKDLREDCDRTKAAADPDPDATHARIRRERTVRFWSQAGVAKMFAQTSPEQMAIIKAAIEGRAEELFHAHRRASDPQPRDHYLTDGLAQICGQYLGDTIDHETTDGEPDITPKAKPAKPVYLGLVRVDHAALVRGWVEGEEICEIAGLGPIPVRVARELLGDALLYLLITKGTAVAQVLNLKRPPTVAQRMALLWMHPTCAIDTCDRTVGLEIDHVEDWADTHTTILSQLRRYCDHHHDLKSHHGWQPVTDHGGRLIMVPPDDPRHPARAPDPPGDQQRDDAA